MTRHIRVYIPFWGGSRGGSKVPPPPPPNPTPLKFEKCAFYLGFLVLLQIDLVIFKMLWCPCQKSWNRPRHSLKLGDIEIVSSVNVSIRMAVETLLDHSPLHFWRGAGFVVCLFCFSLFFVCLFVCFVFRCCWVLGGGFCGGFLCVFLVF